MKNKLVKNISAIACVLLTVLFLDSCESADIVVSRTNSELSYASTIEIGAFCVTVNISTGTFHLDEECRYVVKTKEENKKIIYYTDAQTVLEDGYSPCSVCAGEYKN